MPIFFFFFFILLFLLLKDEAEHFWKGEKRERVNTLCFSTVSFTRTAKSYSEVE